MPILARPTPRPRSPTTEAPLDPSRTPAWQLPVNRDRLYDFYAKEAEHFGKLAEVPPLLPPFPGLDGGKLGHWGNQNEATWADDRWNATDLGNPALGRLPGGRRDRPQGGLRPPRRQGRAGRLLQPRDPDL